MTGRFIVLEGIDGAGTTTQLDRVTSRLTALGHATLATREPTGSAIGKLIRQGLRAELTLSRETLALLFSADRLDHIDREITPALAAGTHVVADRYVMSSIAYQSQDVPLAFVETINARAITPQLTLLVDVPVDIAMARCRSRGGTLEIFEYEAFQERVRASYLAAAKRAQDRGENVVVIDGAASIDAVFTAIWVHVKSCLELAD